MNAREKRVIEGLIADRDAARAEVATLQQRLTTELARNRQLQERNDALELSRNAEVERLRGALDEAASAIKLLWDAWGEHDDECPEDDTCECELVALVNRSVAKIRAALGEEPPLTPPQEPRDE